MLKVAKHTKKTPADLIGPDIPEELAYILNWYLEMRGGEPLAFQEIKAWSDMTGNHLDGFEIDVLRSLDRTYWRTLNE